jgi:hypothetical protein
MSDRGPVIRLQGGPGDGQAFYEEDFRGRIIAAHTGWAAQRTVTQLNELQNVIARP